MPNDVSSQYNLISAKDASVIPVGEELHTEDGRDVQYLGIVEFGAGLGVLVRDLDTGRTPTVTADVLDAWIDFV